MANNLTEKELNDLYEWAKEQKIEGIENKEDILNLKKLNIALRNLIELPKKIGNLINLKYLDIRDCDNLIELPKEIGNLTNLKMITISCKHFKEFPIKFYIV